MNNRYWNRIWCSLVVTELSRSHNEVLITDNILLQKQNTAKGCSVGALTIPLCYTKISTHERGKVHEYCSPKHSPDR